MEPTNHWLLHVGHQWALAKAIFDTFIAERLHTRSKALCRDIDNTLDFEESALSRALAHHASSESTCVRDSLAGKVRLSDIPDFTCESDCCVVFGERISAGHIVKFNPDGRVGKVVACLKKASEDRIVLLVEVLSVVHPEGVPRPRCCSVCRSTGHSAMWDSRGVLCASEWKTDALNTTVLQSAQLHSATCWSPRASQIELTAFRNGGGCGPVFRNLLFTHRCVL